MQAKIKDEEQPKEFYPFTLEIRIENLEELANLWCRLNCDGITIQERNKDLRASDIMNFNSCSNTELWQIVDVKANKYNIGSGF